MATRNPDGFNQRGDDHGLLHGCEAHWSDQQRAVVADIRAAIAAAKGQ